MKDYRDIDYDSFPVADLDLDMHWIQLPLAVLRERELARQAALQAQRIAEQPPDHQIILVPADATYSPQENELWPIINYTVQAALKPHEAACADVMRAVHLALDEYRGWKNPYPVSTEYPSKPITKKARA